MPIILCDEWTPAQVKAFRLMVNRSVTWAAWDEELLKLELADLQDFDFDLSLTGFDAKEIDALTLETNLAEDEDSACPQDSDISHPGSLAVWTASCLMRRFDQRGRRNASVERQPAGLMVTDPSYGIELDSEWRDKAETPD